MGEEMPIKCSYCGKLHVGGVSGCWKKAWDEQQASGGMRKSQGKRANRSEEDEEYDDEHPGKESRRA
jgi:hypothetical protein